MLCLQSQYHRSIVLWRYKKKKKKKKKSKERIRKNDTLKKINYSHQNTKTYRSDTLHDQNSFQDLRPMDMATSTLLCSLILEIQDSRNICLTNIYLSVLSFHQTIHIHFDKNHSQLQQWHSQAQSTLLRTCTLHQNIHRCVSIGWDTFGMQHQDVWIPQLNVRSVQHLLHRLEYCS